MLAEELFVRAGGLAPVNALIDENFILSNGARRYIKARILMASQLRSYSVSIVI